MAAGLAQAPLPWLPADATEIAGGVGLVTAGDGSGQVWVHGMMTFCWQGGDEASRRLAAVQLAELKAATQKQAAAGFGTTPMTVWRWADAYRRHGVAGLIPQRRGPKGPSKVTAELAEQIRELAAGGSLSQQQVAQRCGVSEFTVRAVLGKVGSRREAAARLAAGDAAAGNAAGDAAPGWAQDELPEQELPVLPDPVRRDGERALARFGLLGEGAVPVFTPAAKVPYAGLLLALPALAATGLAESARTVYGRLRNGFYGLQAVLVLLALLREPRAEGATRVPPAALGRVLGLDRAPEVKTIRRKLAELAAAG